MTKLVTLLALGFVQKSLGSNELTPISDSLRDCDLLVRSFEGTYYDKSLLSVNE
jgi:hypothetical protein